MSKKVHIDNANRKIQIGKYTSGNTDRKNTNHTNKIRTKQIGKYKSKGSNLENTMRKIQNENTSRNIQS